MKFVINGESVNVPYEGVTEEQLTTALEAKQDVITGSYGQIVGFSTTGKPVAKNPPTTNLISVKFVGTKFNDEPYTISYSGESYQGVAHDGETVLAFVKSANTNYKVSCAGTTYQISSWSYGIVSPVEFIPVNCTVTVNVTGLPSLNTINSINITGPSGQSIMNPPHAINPNVITFQFTAKSPGEWDVIVEYKDISSGERKYCFGSVTISATDTEQSVTISASS